MSRFPFGPKDTSSYTSSLNNRRRIIDSVFASGFPYSRRLSAHKSCVNALSFSHGDGRWLASAGDDLDVKFWDFHQEDINTASFAFHGHRANIMTLAFSASNRYVYSGGADEMIIRYDMTAPSNPMENHIRYLQHTDIIRGIAPHPYQDEVFMSASDDGRILLHDNRESSRMTRAQSTLQNTAEFTDVKCHPIVENLFATSDSRGRVCLRDSRMAFGPLVQRTREGIVRVYNTKLSRRDISHLSNPETSSIAFDHQGIKLSVTMLHCLPTIYSIADPHPIAICSARYDSEGPVPLGERTYVNSCTMKHGSFGGPGLATEDYYATGSDDFRGYVWKIPDPAELLEARDVFSADLWATRPSLNEIAFAENLLTPRYVPVDLSKPAFCLNGHKSIVNSALIHPSFLHILTSGVERDIVLHSATPSSPCTVDLALTDTHVRRIPISEPGDRDRLVRALNSPDHREGDESGDESETILLFDQILRQEDEPDVFTIRRWRPLISSDSDSDMASDAQSTPDEDSRSGYET